MFKHFLAVIGCTLAVATQAQTAPFGLNALLIGAEQKSCPAGTYDESIEKDVTLCLVRPAAVVDVPVHRQSIFILDGRIVALSFELQAADAGGHEAVQRLLTERYGSPNLLGAPPGEQRWQRGDVQMRFDTTKGTLKVADIKLMTENARKKR